MKKSVIRAEEQVVSSETTKPTPYLFKIEKKCRGFNAARQKKKRGGTRRKPKNPNMHGRRADNPLTSACKHSCCCVIPSFDFYLNLTAMFPARVPNFLTNALCNQRVTLAGEVSGAPMGDTAVILLALR